jgi:peptide/nickel transport system permease protein
LLIAGLAAVAAAVVLLAPGWVAPFPPDAGDFANTVAPPGGAHLMGTDQLGRDVWSRIVFGARLSVVVGLVATLLAVGLGSVLGLLAAFVGGPVETLILRIVDVWLSFPELLLALLMIALIGPGPTNVAVAIGIAAAPYYCRLVRAQALTVVRSEYVEAARVLGVPPLRTALRHVLPNVGGPVVVLASLGSGTAISAAAGLSLVGLGSLPPTPEWGAMLAEGQDHLATAWWIAIFPGLAVVAVVLVVTVLGRAMQARSLR